MSAAVWYLLGVFSGVALALTFLWTWRSRPRDADGKVDYTQRGPIGPPPPNTPGTERIGQPTIRVRVERDDDDAGRLRGTV